MVQTFAVFVDGPTTAKIKTANVKWTGLEWACSCAASCVSAWCGRLYGCGFPTELGAKVKTTKVSSGASGGILAKVCTSENFPLYSIWAVVSKHRLSGPGWI